MNKIVKEELDNGQAKKAKKILTSIKAATLAGVMIFTSAGAVNTVSAQQEKNYTISSSEKQLTKDLDKKFTWQFDGDLDDEKSLPTENKEEIVETDKSQDKETVSEPDVEQAVTEEGNVTEGNKYYKFYYVDDLVFFDVVDSKDYSIPEEPVRVWSLKNGKCEYEIVDFSKAENVRIEYLLYLEDVDPAKVDEKYTGIAPVVYYGKEHVVKNYGDASNDEEVRERATMIWNAFHKANEEVGGLKLYDVDTGKEYTIEKLMDIIKYINGAYAAKDGADAVAINDDWINFMLVFLNDDYLIEDVNYKANSDVITEEEVKKHSNLLEEIDLGHLLMGDSANGPFIEWLGDKVKAMYTTSSIDEAVKNYDDYSLALTAVVEGNGFVINGVNYKIGDFHNANDLTFVTNVLISQVLRNNMVDAGYVFNKKNVGEDIVFVTDIFNQFNPVCSDDLVDYIKENGVEVYEGVVEHGDGTNLDIHNYGSVMEMNSINQALSVGKFGIKYYQDAYTNHHDEYLKEKNGGTYEDVLESSYVYTLNNN